MQTNQEKCEHTQIRLLEDLLHFHTIQTCVASKITYCTVGTTFDLKLTSQPLKKYVLYSMNAYIMSPTSSGIVKSQLDHAHFRILLQVVSDPGTL